MFDEIGKELSAESLENMEQANLEQANEAFEQADLESGSFEVESFDSADMESIMDALDLTAEEREVFSAIDSDLMNMPVENASGNAKVYGDCGYTTCSYTKTYYSCAYTKP